jgi:hypothetical protein
MSRRRETRSTVRVRPSVSARIRWTLNAGKRTLAASPARPECQHADTMPVLHPWLRLDRGSRRRPESCPAECIGPRSLCCRHPTSSRSCSHTRESSNERPHPTTGLQTEGNSVWLGRSPWILSVESVWRVSSSCP